MTNDLSCTFLLAGQLPDVCDQPPAVVPVVDGLHVQHGGLDPGLILQGEMESQTQSSHSESLWGRRGRHLLQFCCLAGQ